MQPLDAGNMRLGEAWPTEQEKSPRVCEESGCQACRSGNSERLLGSLACPCVQVCPGQSGVSSMKRGTGALVSTPAPPPRTPAFPCQSSACTWDDHGSPGLDPLLLGSQWGVGAPSPPHSTRFHVRFPPRAVSQSGRWPSGLKSSLLFKAFFLAPGHPGLLGYLGRVVQECETNGAREGGWDSTQWSGVSLWGMGGVPSRDP